MKIYVDFDWRPDYMKVKAWATINPWMELDFDKSFWDPPQDIINSTIH